MPVKLHTNRYGKSRVRLMCVTRHEPQEGRAAFHDVDEWTVQVLLTGDFERVFTHGDNTKVLATDTMKNTVYSLARESKATSMEGFACELVDFLLGRNPQVSGVEVEVQSTLWKRLTVDGEPFPTAFMRGSDERQTTVVSREQNGTFRIRSGFDRLTIMKTANSGFVGYIRDSLTTLPETTDRLFATAVTANWPYTDQAIADGIDFDKVRKHLRSIMIDVFAKHDSLSVQQTLYAMAEAALEHTGIIGEVYMLMPNKHQLLANLAPFKQNNPNHIFVPTDDPHGTIEATVVRA